MKILTKKKQKAILELLIESGSIVSKDTRIPFNTYNIVNKSNYDIADLVGGFEMTKKYYSAMDRVFQEVLAKMGE